MKGKSLSRVWMGFCALRGFLQSIDSFWGEVLRVLFVSSWQVHCEFCQYQLEILPIRKVATDSIGTNDQCFREKRKFSKKISMGDL